MPRNYPRRLFCHIGEGLLLGDNLPPSEPASASERTNLVPVPSCPIVIVKTGRGGNSSFARSSVRTRCRWSPITSPYQNAREWHNSLHGYVWASPAQAINNRTLISKTLCCTGAYRRSSQESGIRIDVGKAERAVWLYGGGQELARFGCAGKSAR